MRTSALVIGLTLVFFATTGVNECYPKKSNKVMCNGKACDIVIHLNTKCEPVDAAGNSMMSVHVKPNSAVCFFNDAQCTFRLTFPAALFGSDHAEVTLKPGECSQVQVSTQAMRKTLGYQIACDCPEVGGGNGNPEFKVGGGGGEGGGGG
jgi:hypothetical protein